MVNSHFAPKTCLQAPIRLCMPLDRKVTLIYNKRINIRAFADRSGLLAMALFLTADIFDEDLSA